MDPLSIAAASAGLARLAFSLGQSLQSGIEQVRSVDTTLQDFAGETSTLAKSLELVDGGLRDFASRGLDARNGTSISQVLNTLKKVLTDCEDTLVKLDKVIQEASKANISSLRQQINSYNTAMQTTLHMLTISLLLSQSQPSTEMQSRLRNGITSLEASKNSLRSRIASFPQSEVLDASRSKVNNLNHYLQLSESVLSSASTYIGSISGSAIDNADISSHVDSSVIPLGAEQRRLIDSWIDGEYSEPLQKEDFNARFDNRRLELAAKKINQGEYADAEKLLKKFLANAETPGDRPEYQILETKITLAVCYHGQNKFQEAIDQLLPLLESKDLSEEQISHLNSRLAESYLKNSNTNEALQHALTACQRRYHMRTDEKYFESCLLVAKIYLAMDEKVEAEVYMDDLPPSYRSQLATPSTSTDNPQNHLKLAQSNLEPLASRIVSVRLKMSLKGHRGRIFSIAFSPDGHFIASGSFDATVKIWDAVTGKEVKCLNGHRSLVSSVKFSPDGESIVSGSQDRTVKIWNVTTGKLSATLKGHIGDIRAVSISPNGQMVASGSEDERIRLWELPSGKIKRILEGHSKEINSVAFSPNGRSIVSGSDDTTIKLWDTTSGTLEATLTRHSKLVMSVAFSHSGRYLASGSVDSSLKIWDMETKKLTGTVNTKDHVVSVAFSPSDGDVVFTLVHGEILCCNLATGVITTLRGAGSEIYYFRAVCLSPDGCSIACGAADGMDGRVEIWELEYA